MRLVILKSIVSPSGDDRGAPRFSFTLALLLIATIVSAQQRSGNPIAEGWYADPEAVVMDGRYWVFPTYSAEYDKQLHFDA
ncbi:MAG: hypothetical protein IJQ48_03790, partial [Prevotella sp.]|nr:hypothetical protein [Prevotella sp.]